MNQAKRAPSRYDTPILPSEQFSRDLQGHRTTVTRTRSLLGWLKSLLGKKS